MTTPTHDEPLELGEPDSLAGTFHDQIAMLKRDLAAAQEALEQERRYTRSLVSDPLPKSPLRDLGEWLADHLDEDRWKNCEANFLIPALAYLKEAQERAQRAETLAEQNAKDAKEAIAIAGFLFDAWEDGTPCFETDGESGMGASIGKAFKLSNEDFTRCTEFLNRVDPRGAAIDAAIAGEPK